MLLWANYAFKILFLNCNKNVGLDSCNCLWSSNILNTLGLSSNIWNVGQVKNKKKYFKLFLTQLERKIAYLLQENKMWITTCVTGITHIQTSNSAFDHHKCYFSYFIIEIFTCKQKDIWKNVVILLTSIHIIITLHVVM